MPRKQSPIRKVRVATILSVGALATLDVNVGAISLTATDPLQIISAHLTWKMTDVPVPADDGQEFGLSHGDYTAAEVEECLEALSSIDLGNKIAQEQANRLVRSIGTMENTSAGTDGGMNFASGRQVKTKLNWRLSSGHEINLWIRNGSDTVWTTGANISVQGVLWVRDL